MTYVVAGVSGHTGAVVAETLLDQGKKVRVLVRDRAKGERFAKRGAEVAVADLADASALVRAFEGASGAFVLIPPKMQAQDFRAYQRTVIDAIAAAAEVSGLPHLVLLSSIGAQHAAKVGPIAGIHEAEQRFRRLPATKSTFVRASSFAENFATALGMLDQGVLPSFLPASYAYDLVATADIAKVAATALVEGAKETTVIELGGPAYSANDAAAALAELVGKPIRVQEAPISAVAPMMESFGASASLAALYQELMAGIGTGQVAWEGGHRRVQGTTPLKTVLAGLLQR